MRFEMDLLYFYLAVGLIAKRLTPKGWLGVMAVTAGFILYNWKRV